MLPLRWCEYPAEETGALPHRVKASGPGLEKLMEDPREGGAAAGLSAAPHQRGEPADKWQRELQQRLIPCTSLPSVKTICFFFTSTLQFSGKMSLVAWPSQKHTEGSSVKRSLAKVTCYKAILLWISSQGSHYSPEDNLIKLCRWKCKAEDHRFHGDHSKYRDSCQAHPEQTWSWLFLCCSSIENLAHGRHCT